MFLLTLYLHVTFGLRRNPIAVAFISTLDLQTFHILLDFSNI